MSTCFLWFGKKFCNAGGGMYMLDDVTRNTRHCTTLMKCAEGALVGVFA